MSEGVNFLTEGSPDNKKMAGYFDGGVSVVPGMNTHARVRCYHTRDELFFWQHTVPVVINR